MTDPTASTPLKPPPLASGARVALLAPAGPLKGELDLERASENARALGWEPVPGAHVMSRLGYLAGSDTERLDDLNSAIRDKSIDGIWFVRGGYGVLRLLEGIDYAALAARPIAMIGFSDITALHVAVASRAGVQTYHGPCARGELSAFTRESLTRAVVGRDSCGVAPAARTLRGGTVRGPLVGGNLALLAALTGTPYLHFPDGAILVLEDVTEPVYRIDRMLRQLRLAGILPRCAGLAFGAFTERGNGEEGGNDDASLETVLRETADLVGGPAIAGAPVGHVADQWTWPVGAMAELDADVMRVNIGADDV